MGINFSFSLFFTWNSEEKKDLNLLSKLTTWQRQSCYQHKLKHDFLSLDALYGVELTLFSLSKQNLNLIQNIKKYFEFTSPSELRPLVNCWMYKSKLKMLFAKLKTLKRIILRRWGVGESATVLVLCCDDASDLWRGNLWWFSSSLLWHPKIYRLMIHFLCTIPWKNVKLFVVDSFN